MIITPPPQMADFNQSWRKWLYDIYKNVSKSTLNVVNVIDYGAIGDGVADDTSAINEALAAGAGGTVLFDSGTYLCTTLIVKSNTTLIGNGRGNTTIKAAASLAGTSPLMRNENIGFSGLDAFLDENIKITGITFDGSDLGTRSAGLLEFGKVKNILFTENRVTNVRYIGIAFGGCRNIVIKNNNLDDIGEPTAQPVAGPAIWMGTAGDSTKNKRVLITENIIEACNEAGINGGADDITISNNKIIDVKEAGIFISSEFLGVVIIGNVIDTVTKNNISSTGIEVGCSDLLISGNRIANINGSCISLTDTQRVHISGNHLENPRRDSVSFAQGGFIDIITTLSSPNQPKLITITGNRGYITGGNNAYSAIHIGNSGTAVENVTIESNSFEGLTFTSGSAILWESGKRGTNCATRNNAGCEDFDPVKSSVQNRATTGTQSITGIGFKPRRVSITAVKASSTEIVTSDSDTDESLVSTTIYYSTSTVGTVSSISGNAINLVSTSGTNDVIGTISSYDDDGFTLSFSTVNYQAWLRYTAYP